MTRLQRLIPGALLLMALASCSTTTEMPLAPNMVRLDTQASGLIATSGAGASTLKRAAEITLARGYTHFRIEQASTSSGSRVIGVQANTTGWGNSTFRGAGASHTFGGTTTYVPMRAPTSHIGVTVVMYRATDAGARGAFNASEIVKSNGKI